MESAAPPDWVLFVLMVLVPVLLIGLGVGIPILSIVIPRIAHTTAGGVNFWFTPRDLQRGFNHESVSNFVRLYAARMPEAFRQTERLVTADDLMSHFASVRCEFKEGPLTTTLRSADLDMDGKANALTGLTLSERRIQVAVLDSMKHNGAIRVERTALSYELHNTAIWAFLGYDVTIAESFVRSDDKAITSWLGKLSLEQAKEIRSKLDHAFWNLNHQYQSSEALRLRE